MKSYLENWYESVTVNDTECNKVSSKFELIKLGVPQGCILGQLLFLI